MPISPGVRLGAYEVVRLIGAGAMGEVYQARDTRLSRMVALKILPSHLAEAIERRERFEREARAVAALNHPHICSLHDVCETPTPDAGGGIETVRFIVMEYVVGQTLAERLVAGPLPLPEVITWGMQIADAMDHAHRRGVVHRDVKPANIMLTEQGVKLLDFGLSKLRPEARVAALGTVTSEHQQLTAEGAVLGTYPYISPEQLAGRDADSRGDIFSLGATLYEMATGRRAFHGETAATVIGAVLHEDPPAISTLRPTFPAGLDHVVARCLAKSPDLRWQTARDVMFELQWIDAQKAVRPVERRRWHVRAAAVLAITTVLLLGSAGALKLGDSPGSLPGAVRLSFNPPDGVSVADLVIGGPIVISPDGAHLAFVASARDGMRRVWVRPLESAAARPLAGSEDGAYPFWSPDSQWLGFFAHRKLKKIAIAGGPVQTLCDAIVPRGGTWNRADVLLFSAGAGRELYRVSAAGGPPVALPADGVNRERYWPVFLPDGRHFVYFGRPERHGIYIDAIDAPAPRQLVAGAVSASYSAAGYLVTLQGSTRGAPAATLFAHPFDAERLRITGKPMVIAERVRYESGLARGAFSVSDGTTLVYGEIPTSEARLTWFGRTGSILGSAGGVHGYGQPSLSPDEQTVVVERVDPLTQDQDLWLIDTQRGVSSRFTSHPDNITFMPVWAPDGRRIVFASARGTPPNLYLKPSGGAGDAVRLRDSALNNQPTDWSRDGRFIVYAELDARTQWDLWLLPVTGSDRRPIPLLRTDFNEHLGRLSPDGRWLAYTSDESGGNEVYLREVGMSGRSRRISLDGGRDARWRADGRELFYLTADGRMMAVPVKPRHGDELEVGRPEELFSLAVGPVRNSGYDVNYAVTSDGRRFLASVTVEPRSPAAVSVVVNWPAAASR